jgi:phosphoribosylformimino-5-aminoimidazole carboxamide ribotide isomerase
MDRGLGTLDLCRRLRAARPSLELISGGGVRSHDDLRLLSSAGCDWVLVASALHDGRLSQRPVLDFG